MPLINLVKKNIVLVIGLTLPIMLIMLFFVASVLPKSMATPPQYELLFSTSHYDGPNSSPYIVKFVVKEGMLRALVTKNDSNKNISYNTRKLMAYDGKTDSVREIALDIPKIGDVRDGAAITLDETSNMKVDTANKAPDGYVFEGPSYGSSGLMTEIFFGGHRGEGYRVKKGMIGYRIPNISGNYYNDVQFIGWVVEKR